MWTEIGYSYTKKKMDLLEIDVDSSELSFLLTKSSKINRNNQ